MSDQLLRLGRVAPEECTLAVGWIGSCVGFKCGEEFLSAAGS